VNVPTGRQITDATIVASTLRMPMNSASTMDASASFVASQSSGYYRFVVRVPMTGDWLLDLTAKVPGEPGVIRAAVPPLHRNRRAKSRARASGGTRI